MKVRYRITYHYDSSKTSPFRATIYLTLPKRSADDHRLAEYLCNPNAKCLGYSLTTYWGAADDLGRTETLTVEGDSWDEVKQVAHDELERAIATLKEVYKRNIVAVASRPVDEHGEVDLRPE